VLHGKSFCPVADHLSVDELRARMSEAVSIEQFRRQQVIFVRLTVPRCRCPASRNSVPSPIVQSRSGHGSTTASAPDGYTLSGREEEGTAIFPQMQRRPFSTGWLRRPAKACHNGAGSEEGIRKSRWARIAEKIMRTTCCTATGGGR